MIKIQYYEYLPTKSTRISIKARVFGEFDSRKFNNRIMFFNLHQFILSMFSSLDPTNRSSKYNLLPSESALQIYQKYMDELYLRTSSECLRKLIGKTLNYPRQRALYISLLIFRCLVNWRAECMEQDKLKPEQRLPDETSGIHSSPDRWQLLLVLTFDFLQIRLRACSPCNRRVPLDLARLLCDRRARRHSFANAHSFALLGAKTRKWPLMFCLPFF